MCAEQGGCTCPMLSEMNVQQCGNAKRFDPRGNALHLTVTDCSRQVQNFGVGWGGGGVADGNRRRRSLVRTAAVAKSARVQTFTCTDFLLEHCRELTAWLVEKGTSFSRLQANLQATLHETQVAKEVRKEGKPSCDRPFPLDSE